LLGAVGGGRAWLASLWSPASVDLVGTLQPLIKRWLKVLSSSWAWAFDGEDASRLLAQPAAGATGSLVSAGLPGWMSW
jgi:hypothetical protein